LKYHLMASCIRNVYAKNRQNPLILFKVTIDNVGVPFLRHSVEKRTSKMVRIERNIYTQKIHIYIRINIKT